MKTLLDRFIDVKYVINNTTLTERFDTNQPFENFLKIIEVTQKLNPEDYEVFYMGYKLAPRYYFYSMRDIITIDISPIFYIEKVTRMDVKKIQNRRTIAYLVNIKNTNTDLIDDLQTKFKITLPSKAKENENDEKISNYRRTTLSYDSKNSKRSQKAKPKEQSICVQSKKEATKIINFINKNYEDSGCILKFKNKDKVFWENSDFKRNIKVRREESNRRMTNLSSLPSNKNVVRELSASAKSSRLAGALESGKYYVYIYIII